MYISRTPKRAALDRALNRSVAIAVGEADVGRADKPTAKMQARARADATLAAGKGKPASSSAGQARSWATVVKEQDELKTGRALEEVPTFMH